MNCPKCGAEIRDGYLYCEKCGEEIRIVPEFDPQIEYSMHETLSGIVEEVLEEIPAEQIPEEKEAVGRKKHIRLRVIVAVCVCSLVLLLTVVGIGALQNYRYNSVGYQLSRASACFNAGEYEKAIGYYIRALELDESNVSLRFTLADLYEQAGMEKEYLESLLAVMKSPYATEEEVVSAYKKAIAYYKERQDYASINTLLMNTEDESIRVMFQNYMALAPEFSYKEGTYAEVIPLKLTSSTQGTIYYTTDGSIPDENSEVYTTPIFLETGSYTISALFINEYGISSEVVAKTYVIDVLKPEAPDVETYSGEYTTPTFIKVLVPSGCDVYYTTDGTVPTSQSALYAGAIPMPLGKSTFKFITYNEDGVSGDCTTREFELVLQTDFSVEQAVERLVETMLQTGKIKDYAGTPSGDLSGRYLYQYQYVLAIPEQGDFYIIAEVYEDSAGVQNRTGTTYAVNVYSLECFKLTRGALDDYILEAFQ